MRPMDTFIASLLEQIGRYCEMHGISEKAFGLHAVNDGKFVADLRNGRDPRMRTIRKVQRALDRPPPSQFQIAARASQPAVDA